MSQKKNSYTAVKPLNAVCNEKGTPVRATIKEL